MLSAGREVQVVEEEEGVSLERRQQELAVKVLSLYLEVDSSRMAEHVTSSQMVNSLVGTGEDKEEFDPVWGSDRGDSLLVFRNRAGAFHPGNRM